MLVRPCVQNAPGKNGDICPLGYSLHPRQSGPEIVQETGGVTASPTLLGPFGMEPAELSAIAVDREVFRVLLGLLPPRFSPKETWAQK